MTEQWATVDLMGHAQTAGRISFDGGLLRVDVPDGDGYRTEYFGLAAIYSVKIVSEEIARAYAHQVYDAMPYDAPIVTREQFQAERERWESDNRRLRKSMYELERRLTAINETPALGSGAADHAPTPSGLFGWDDRTCGTEAMKKNRTIGKTRVMEAAAARGLLVKRVMTAEGRRWEISNGKGLRAFYATLVEVWMMVRPQAVKLPEEPSPLTPLPVVEGNQTEEEGA